MAYIPKHYRNLLDVNKILKKTKNINDLKIMPIESKGKVKLYARKEIDKTEIIAYYKIKIYDFLKYSSPTHGKYQISIYNHLGTEQFDMIGDIYSGSIPKPIQNIPFWGPFITKTTNIDNSNVELEFNPYYYKNLKIKVGETLIFNFIAKRTIKKGEEILWFYNDS